MEETDDDTIRRLVREKSFLHGEVERVSGENLRLTRETERLSGECQRLTGDAQRLSRDASRLSEENESLRARLAVALCGDAVVSEPGEDAVAARLSTGAAWDSEDDVPIAQLQRRAADRDASSSASDRDALFGSEEEEEESEEEESEEEERSRKRPRATKATSRFYGVSFKRDRKRWKVTYRNSAGKQVQLGNFADEESAALAYNRAIQENNLQSIRPLNPVDAEGRLAADFAKKQGSSKYFGVGWVSRNQKWQARVQLVGERKTIHLGLHVDELDAARAVDKYLYASGDPDLAAKANFPRA